MAASYAKTFNDLVALEKAFDAWAENVRKAPPALGMLSLIADKLVVSRIFKSAASDYTALDHSKYKVAKKNGPKDDEEQAIAAYKKFISYADHNIGTMGWLVSQDKLSTYLPDLEDSENLATLARNHDCKNLHKLLLAQRPD